MADITGTYKLTSSEHFDDYLKAVGVNFILRKLATTVESATVEITKNGEEYTIKTTTAVKSAEIKFKLGEPFTEHTMDGRDVETTFTLEGNLLKQVQHDIKGGFDSFSDREFNGDELITTMRCKDAVAVRKYKKE
ncbi:putative Cellular retinoic acid-binding protein 1 [Hypsibius exemplaris]|uniref:Cellular retinoic acid-binding protein 1 n=1 Tax=Hypsibius exemplaris TaxID=2072580 RepID=A0A1W0X4F5_HYPEX|nr:putative Cellular retinoic acid-binding protein 1 [Hypsibius exemplaris]